MLHQTHPQPETIPLSYLNALEYCPRRFYYEFVLGDMITNEFVLEGTLLHQKTDVPGKHTNDDGETQINRLHLHSHTLRLSGFADLIEEENNMFIPVEYKHGKEGKWLNDHVQLCAQALCLEEHYPQTAPIPYGYIFYYGSRKRVQVSFTETLRTTTINTIKRAFQIAQQRTSPPPLTGKQARRCRDCSLRPLCLPEEILFLQQKESEHAHTLSD